MTIALTSGEPSGIGPDIAIIYAQKERTENLRVYADPDALIERAKLLKLPLILKESSTNKAGELSIFPIKSKEKTVPGQLNPNNAEYVLSIIKQATHDCLNKTCNGIVTGPINKAVINQAGIKFSGHTEYLAELSNCSKTVMLLATTKLKVALATTHLALKDVPKNITKENFSKFGDMITTDGINPIEINEGFAKRFDGIANLNTSKDNGETTICIFSALKRSFPMKIDMMEKHPLGSQAFIPMKPTTFLAFVAPEGDKPDLNKIESFIVPPGIGVNYNAGIWHFPLISTEDMNFLVVDRKGSGDNLKIQKLEENQIVLKY